MVLSRILGPRKDEVTRGLKKLDEELHFYSLPILVRMTKPRRMRCAGNVARMGRRGIRVGYR
jgi:hypothetical protein